MLEAWSTLGTLLASLLPDPFSWCWLQWQGELDTEDLWLLNEMETIRKCGQIFVSPDSSQFVKARKPSLGWSGTP